MTYVLHYAPDNASLIVRLVLEELHLPNCTVLVDRRRTNQRSAGYRALNPAGLIPTFETTPGPVFETAAILLWLADRHAGMAPASDTASRGDFLKWLFFFSNTLHSQLRMVFYPAKYVGDDPATQEYLHRTLTERSRTYMTLPCAFDLLDSRLRELGDAPPGTPDVLDYYIAALLLWCRLYPAGRTAWFDLQQYRRLHRLAKRLKHRPAAHAAQTAEGLGKTPFTAPAPPNPPEGSAT